MFMKNRGEAEEIENRIRELTVQIWEMIDDECIFQLDLLLAGEM